jgi:hypothetical protein
MSTDAELLASLIAEQLAWRFEGEPMHAERYGKSHNDYRQRATNDNQRDVDDTNLLASTLYKQRPQHSGLVNDLANSLFVQLQIRQLLLVQLRRERRRLSLCVMTGKFRKWSASSPYTVGRRAKQR